MVGPSSSCRRQPRSADLCEHAFVSIKGGSYQRFLRALDVGNPTLVRAAAAELPQVGLEDALGICLVLLDGEPQTYPAEYADYQRIFAETEEVARFQASNEHPGPELRILKVRQP